jgi:hypothetical protein
MSTKLLKEIAAESRRREREEKREERRRRRQQRRQARRSGVGMVLSDGPWAGSRETNSALR